MWVLELVSREIICLMAAATAVAAGWGWERKSSRRWLSIMVHPIGGGGPQGVNVSFFSFVRKRKRGKCRVGWI